MQTRLLLTGLMLLSTTALAASEQVVVPPKARYWMSATTASGMSMGGGMSQADMMRMAMGGGGGPTKMLDLDLGSTLGPSGGGPKADALIPPGMNMGPRLPLTTPAPVQRARESGPDEDFQRPKGKLMLFWGCGEKARPGQPLVIDFASMAAGQIPPNMFGSERIRIARPPSYGNSKTYGGWPQGDPQHHTVPANASLLGTQAVEGNYSPPISFDLTQDWLQALTLSASAVGAGGQLLGWNAVPGATGYVASMMGGGKSTSGEDSTTVVFWISSEQQSFISGLTDYLAPAEVARLVGKQMVMPPSQTKCAIPAEAINAVQGGIISLVAHGPEVNHVSPPRPTDPKVPWVQDWVSRTRFRATAGAMVADGTVMTNMGGSRGAGAAAVGSGGGAAPKNCPPPAPDAGAAAGSSIGGAIAGGMGAAMGGMFGSKKHKTDPNCPQ